MIVTADPAPARNLESVQDAHTLRRLALDAVERFRRVVDEADDAMVEAGADQDVPPGLKGLWKQLDHLVEQAAREVDEAIRAAHLATGAVPFNVHVIDDAGDVLLLEGTDRPFYDEVSYFQWPFSVIRIGGSIRPDR